MNPFASLNDLANSQGQQTGNFAIDVANKAADFACGIYRDFPGAIIPNPAEAYIRGLWDSLCGDRTPGLPQPPAPPFQGGQCPCSAYHVRYYYNGYNTGRQNSYFEYDFWGPIGGIRVVENQFGSDIVEMLCRDSVPYRSCGTYQWYELSGNGKPAGEVIGKAGIISVTPLAGYPNNCGNPPVSPNQNPIPEPRRHTTINHVYNDGTDIDIDLHFPPMNLYAPIVVNIAPNLNINFDFGGVSFEGGNPALPANIQNNINNISNTINNIAGAVTNISNAVSNTSNTVNSVSNIVNNATNTTNSISNVVNQINNAINNTYYTPISGNLNVEPPVSGGSGGISNNDPLAWVEVDIITFPVNPKFQNAGSSPRVFYAGWFEFQVGSYSLPREPIHFEKSIFKAPPGADGYAYFVHTGYQAKVTAYKRSQMP
jgi:hypothetical protein